MQDTIGWQILESKINEEIKDENNEIRKFDVEGRGLQDIGAEYLRHREKINGLERIFEIIQEFITAKEEAEAKLKK